VVLGSIFLVIHYKNKVFIANFKFKKFKVLFFKTHDLKFIKKGMTAPRFEPASKFQTLFRRENVIF